MLIEFTIKGTYQSHEEEDVEVAVKGLTLETLVQAGQVNSLTLSVAGESWSFNYTKDFVHSNHQNGETTQAEQDQPPLHGQRDIENE